MTPQPGDKVKVFSINGRRAGQPEGGWDGEVVKVGRKLVHVQHLPYGPPAVFRLEDGSANGDGRSWFRTLEIAALEQRRTDARTWIEGRGWQTRLGHRPPDDELFAIAALLGWEQ